MAPVRVGTRRSNDRDPNHTGSVVIRVDPEKKLPDLMTFTHGKEKMQARLDYPEEALRTFTP